MNKLEEYLKEQGRLLRAMPVEHQELYLREENRMLWWSWVTVAAPALCMSLVVAVLVVGVAVFFGAVHDPASGDLEQDFQATQPAVAPILREGAEWVFMGVLLAALWAFPASVGASLARFQWVRRWHRHHKTGEVPEESPGSPLLPRLKAWWRGARPTE